MPQRAIVLFPKSESLPVIEKLREQFDPLATMIRAHVTVVFPFESEMTDNALVAHVIAAVEGIGPFQTHFSDIGDVDGDYIFLNTAPAGGTIVHLHDRLYSGVLATFLSTAHTYRPHITVGRVGDPEMRARAATVIRESLSPFDAWIGEISVFRIDDERSGTVTSMVPLR